MNLNFVINDDHLIFHTLFNINRYCSNQDIEGIVAFENKVLEISQSAFTLLINSTISERDILENHLEKVPADVQKLIAVLKTTPEYHTIFGQTEEYKGRIEQEWNTNLDTSLMFMKEMTGLSLEGEYTVFLTNPNLKNGCYLGNRQISWGHFPDFKNYDTIYLWHESLHDDANLGSNNSIAHALIELLTDNTLRAHLNGGNIKPLIGHPHLHFIRAQIYANDWQGYVNSKDKDILRFKEHMIEKYPNLSY